MKISHYLTPENIRIRVSSLVPESLTGHDADRSKTKIGVISEVIDTLVEGYELTGAQREDIENCILHRERQKSTGMERGVAIPHGKTEQVQGLLCCLLVYPDGVDFASLDQKDAFFVFGAVHDYEMSTQGIQVLAGTMRILQRGDVAEEVLAAESPGEVWKIIDRECREIGRL